MYSSKECNRIGSSIERDVEKRWGWKINFLVRPNGYFSWKKINGEDRYDMYPGMSKQEADDVVISEIQEIIRRYMPYSVIRDYEQSGRVVVR